MRAHGRSSWHWCETRATSTCDRAAPQARRRRLRDARTALRSSEQRLEVGIDNHTGSRLAREELATAPLQWPLSQNGQHPQLGSRGYRHVRHLEVHRDTDASVDAPCFLGEAAECRVAATLDDVPV